jgi:hypothetical protein
MNPISVKIEAFGPYSAEQTAEAFQKYCFEQGIESAWGGSELLRLDANAYSVILFTSLGVEDYGRQWFTLPTQWKEFTTYLKEYIEYHQKPQPKVGEYWYLESVSRDYLNGVVKVKCISHCIAGCTYSTGGELSCNVTWLTRPATKEEIEAYQKEQQENELLAEAKKRYPKGSKAVCLFDGLPYEIVGNFGFDLSGDLWHNLRNGDETKVYDAETKLWTDVVVEEQSREEQLPELKKLRRRLTNKSARVSELERALREIEEAYERYPISKLYARIREAKELLNKKP